jgi:hypothetical protein
MALMRIYARIGACLGWFALLLQLLLMFQSSPADVRSLLATVVTFFSFFTILTNLLVALVFTAVGFHPSGLWPNFFRGSSVQASTAVYITVVGAVYWLLLKQLWDPQGAQWLADTLLHTWQPVAYVLYWLLFALKKRLRWVDAVVWLAYPAVYLAYILARGAVTRLYPYPFVDVNALGYARVFAYAGMLLVVFLGLGLITVGAGRRLATRSGSKKTTAAT